MNFLGIVLIVLGVLALACGVAGGVAKMFLEIKREAEQGARPFGITDLPTQLMEVLIKFLQALAAAPLWLALVAIGLLLVAWGGSML